MCVVTEIFIFISLIHTGLCTDIPAPVNLSISSEYLHHLLFWSKRPGTPAGVHYTVSMRSSSSTNAMLVKGCEEVTSPLQCNLTQAFSDPFEIYYASVSAVLENRTSSPAQCTPFKPVVNSTLWSPLVSVSICNKSLCVGLRSPSPDLHHIYNSFKFVYRLTFTSEDGPQLFTPFERDVTGLQNVTVNDVAPGRRYCVNVSIINHRCSSRPAVCVSTPRTDNISVTGVLMAVGLCLLMLPLVMWVMPRLLSYFLFQKVDLPEVLKSFENHPQVYRVLLIPPESISTLTEDTDALQKMKKNTDEHEETDGDAVEDCVMYERLATQHLQAQDTSSSSGFVSESSCGCGSLAKPTSGIQESSADVQSSGCSVAEEDGVSKSHHLLTETRALIKCVDEPDGAALEDEDVNLCSVLLHHDTSCSSTHEFELITDSFETPVNIHMSDCEQESEEEYSEYLSRC